MVLWLTPKVFLLIFNSVVNPWRLCSSSLTPPPPPSAWKDRLVFNLSRSENSSVFNDFQASLELLRSAESSIDEGPHAPGPTLAPQGASRQEQMLKDVGEASVLWGSSYLQSWMMMENQEPQPLPWPLTLAAGSVTVTILVITVAPPRGETKPWFDSLLIYFRSRQNMKPDFYFFLNAQIFDQCKDVLNEWTAVLLQQWLLGKMMSYRP